VKIEHARTPKQSRSRESFDRVLDAATELVTEGGYRALTLAEVSRRSRVSIGSIYCRVESKDDLFRAMQARSFAAIEDEFSTIVTRIRRRRLPLRELVPQLVKDLAGHLQRHSRLIAACIERGASDPVVGALGRKAHTQTGLDFRLLLLERHAEFVHPDPEHAASTCFHVVYGSLARYLGFGMQRDHSGVAEGNWKQLIADLGLMCLAFLAADLRKITGATDPVD
jgi:AcrR family transcriptional regulator